MFEDADRDLRPGRRRLRRSRQGGEQQRCAENALHHHCVTSRNAAVVVPLSIVYEGKKFLSNRKNIVSKGYSLSSRKVRVCRFVGTAFLIVALLWAVAATAQALAPGWSFSCDADRPCRQWADPTALLREPDRAAVAGDPAAQARFAAYVDRPIVRAGLGALVAADEGLLVVLLAAMGMTLLRLGGRGDQVLARALPWLKRGALAGLLWAIAQPVTDSLRAMLLSPGTPAGASWFIGIDLTVAGPALLLAIAAYTVAWALEAGVRATRDLADFV